MAVKYHKMSFSCVRFYQVALEFMNCGDMWEVIYLAYMTYLNFAYIVEF